MIRRATPSGMPKHSAVGREWIYAGVQCRPSGFLDLGAIRQKAGQRFEILAQRDASRCADAVRALGLPVLKFLIANDISGCLQPPRLDTQIAVGCLQEVAQLRKSQRFLHDQRRDDAESQTFVD